MIFRCEIWRYIDFQNGGHPPSWNCFTTIRDHPRSLCCWPQLPVKFHVNLIHRSKDSYLNFSHIWLEMPIQAHKMGVLGNFGPINVIIHHREPQKAHPCVNPRLLSYQLQNPLRGLTCRRVDRKCDGYTDRQTDRQTSSSFVACNSRLRSAIRRHHPPQRAVLSQICCFTERKMVLFQTDRHR